MLWQINSPPCSVEQFHDRNIVEILYEFNGPKIFLTDSGSLQRLWYECGEDQTTGTLRYLVVPASARLVEQLKVGTRTVYDALRQPWIWAVDIDVNDAVVGGWVVDLDLVPETAKPAPEAPLWPSLEPLISYRLIGKGLKEGSIPASVVARAMERPAAALKRLFEAVSNTASQGRPEDAFRRIYDLPATRFAFNSFEVSFAAPHELDPIFEEHRRSVYSSSAESLGAAFTWLDLGGTEPDIGVLEALKELAPPAHGQVEKTEVRGRLISSLGAAVVLTRDNRLTVTRAIAQKRSSERDLLRTEGRIGEFDKDQLTFILRDRSDLQADLKCSFNEDQFDDVYDAFDGDLRVVLLGRMHAVRNILEVVAAEPVGQRVATALTGPEGGQT